MQADRQSAEKREASGLGSSSLMESRTRYLASVEKGGTSGPGSAGIDRGSDQTLFEAILNSGLPDERTHIVWRDELVCVLLNRYPYSVGHLLVVPCRAVAQLEDLENAERTILWETVHASVAAVKAAFKPDGVNIGANIGVGSGPSVADHLHIHVVPRWLSDTNFMTAVADARVLPQTLEDTWKRLREVWLDPI